MLIKKGVDVFSSDDEKLGTIHRVVLNPKTKEITHLIVKQGFFFTEDKVIPMDRIGPVTEERIIVHGSRQDLDELPLYEETHYVPIDIPDKDDKGTVYWYPPITMPWDSSGQYLVIPQTLYMSKTTRNIPEGLVALEEGARVISEDGQHIGNIEGLITNPADERVTHVVISSGLLLKERKMIPAFWLDKILEDEVHLSVESRLLEGLPEFHPER